MFRKPIRFSTVILFLAVILLMLFLSNREQNKTHVAAIPSATAFRAIQTTQYRPQGSAGDWASF